MEEAREQQMSSGRTCGQVWLARNTGCITAGRLAQLVAAQVMVRGACAILVVHSLELAAAPNANINDCCWRRWWCARAWLPRDSGGRAGGRDKQPAREQPAGFSTINSSNFLSSEWQAGGRLPPTQRRPPAGQIELGACWWTIQLTAFGVRARIIKRMDRRYHFAAI